MNPEDRAVHTLLSRGLPAVLSLFVLSGCTELLPTDADATAPAPSFDVAGVVNSGAVPEFVEGQLIVRFRPGAARSEVAQQNRARVGDPLLVERVWVLEVAPGEELEIARNLQRNPNIEFAEPNYIYSVVPCAIGDCTLPSDAVFGGKWDLHNSGFITNALGDVLAETGLAGADIKWLETFEYLSGSGITPSATIVGIIDTGIRANHQDLAGKVVAGRNYCPSLFCLIGTVNPNAWADDNGHGTHVAGIAAAHANNGVGVAGVAYMEEVRLLAVKVCGGPLGLCNAAGITNGIIWAVDNGAHVLNLSLGGGAPSAATQSALQYALANNVLPVCATGNDGAASVSYPAAFPECMAVGSTNWSDARASYSNYGPQVEVTAPGGDVGEAPHSYILSSWYTADNAYAYAAGTSMATPQVAGLAALLRATGMTNASEIRARIRSTADDLGAAGFDNEYGDGRINVYRAVTQMDPYISMTVLSRPVINTRSQGRVQVVLLAREAETFNLGMLRLETVSFGGAALAVRPNGTFFATWADQDGDGLADLVLQFDVPAIVAGGVDAGTTQVTLRGQLDDGRLLRADVPVQVVN